METYTLRPFSATLLPPHLPFIFYIYFLLVLGSHWKLFRRALDEDKTQTYTLGQFFILGLKKKKRAPQT